MPNSGTCEQEGCCSDYDDCPFNHDALACKQDILNSVLAEEE